MSIQRQLIRGNTATLEARTLLPAQYAFDTIKNEASVGDGATQGGIRLAKKNIAEILSAAQITSDVADYSPAGLKHAGVLNISSDAARNITGLAPTTVTDSTNGRVITLYNTGAFNITLKDQAGASAAANRFDLNGSDLVLSPKSSAMLRYRNAVSRWELVAQTAGAAVSAGAVIARTLAASSQGFSLINGVVVANAAAGALTIAIKTLAGADPSAVDPVLVLFRNGTPGVGDFNLMSLTAATSLVISSGSSLGTFNNRPFTLRLCGINDAGTFRLGAINLGREGAALPVMRTDQFVTSTAEGGAGAADSANVLYTGTAVAGKPVVMIADLDWSAGLTVAGTWDAGPSQIQLYDHRMPMPGHGMPAIAKKFTGLFSGTIVESHAGNAATYAIKTLAGDDPSPRDPVYATFQDGAGGLVVRTITSGLSLTMSSGSTLGFVNNEASRAWLVLIDTGAGVVLGAVNCRSGTSIMGLLDSVAYTTTAEGGAGAADAAQVIYSAAAQAAKYVCIAGYADYDGGLAAVGTWNVSPTRIVLFGASTARPGQIVGGARFDTGAVASGTTAMAFGDAAPANTAGDQYMTLSYVPTAACNILDVQCQAMVSHSSAVQVTAALYQDSGTSALKAASDYVPLATVPSLLNLSHSKVSGATAQTTFKVRCGGHSGATVTFNGSSGSRVWGGVANSYVQIEERMG